jgi:hypothetical protein
MIEGPQWSAYQGVDPAQDYPALRLLERRLADWPGGSIQSQDVEPWDPTSEQIEMFSIKLLVKAGVGHAVEF